MTDAGYSGTPLPRKLGIRVEDRILLVGAPAEVDLGPLPPGVTVHTRPGRSPYDVALLFVRDRATLTRRFPSLTARITPAGMLWVAWPKRASRVPTDLDENVLRDVGLPTGWVDTKVCAIDAVWSGLRFVRRLANR